MNLARGRIGLLVPCVVSMWLLGVAPAAAQMDDGGGDPTAATPVTPDPLKADFKGAIGLGLIGAELGFVLPAAFGAKAWWPYLVFPVIGAAGGAVGGHFALEQGAGHPEVAVAMLVTGVALIIPSLVFTVARTRYDAAEELPTSISVTAQLPASERRAAEAGPGLVRLTHGQVLVRPPSVSVGRSLSPQEARRTGAVAANREYQLAVLSGRF